MRVNVTIVLSAIDPDPETVVTAVASLVSPLTSGMLQFNTRPISVGSPV